MPASHTSSDSSILQRVGVLLPLPLGGVYDYGVRSALVVAPGDFVRVPLGQRSVIGVVWGAAAGDVDPAKLKVVLERLDAPPMSDVVRRFVDWVAAYSLAPPGAVLKMAMSVPAALEAPTPVVGYGLPAGQVAESIAIRLTPARRRVLAVLADGPPRPAVELAREAAAGPAVVRGLFDAGLLEKIALRPRASATAVADWRLPGPVLSADQKTAADALIGKVADGQFSVVLLDGVPGSGKTEVYFEAVARALEAGRQVLVLLPEISLGAQWLARFTARFGAAPHQWHSDLGAAERRRTWRAIATGEARVVVGARSALFLPFAELGLIVVDEEHDAAFKQEEGVIYNARDMAVVRAQLGGAPVVLVSATPSLETVVNARSGRYTALHLPARHGSASMPRSATGRALVVAASGLCTRRNLGRGRTSHAVPQSQGLRAVDSLPSLRPSPAMPALHRLAGRTPPRGTIAVPSLRLWCRHARSLPGLRSRGQARSLRPGRGAPGGRGCGLTARRPPSDRRQRHPDGPIGRRDLSAAYRNP
jgi:primosomal protein N' (replication factor Y)